MVKKRDKNLGLGSLSLLLSLIALVLSLVHLRGGKLGDSIFRFINIPFPYGLFSVGLLIISFNLGKRYNEHTFASIGKKLSKLSITFLITVFLLNFLFAFV